MEKKLQMNLEFKNELVKLTKQYFDIALSHIDQSTELSEKQRKLFTALKLNEEAEVPGFEDRKFNFGKFENRDFVVMMTDIRASTHIINGNNGLVNMFLIFYIYSGIVSKIVDKYGGTSTEYLGDGVLNLFDTKEIGLDAALINSMLASWDIMEARISILNPFFRENDLPEINLGIGIDHGITIVTKFGYRNDTDLKAFGKCVYHASKLCKEVNEILVSQNSQNIWPSGPGGNLLFSIPKMIDGQYAYLTQKTI